MTIYIGENIKRLRLERELTQEELADFLGVSFQSVSRWERGEGYPDIAMLPEIALFFKVSTDELLGVRKAENEDEIVKTLERYDNLRSEWENEKEKWEIVNKLKEEYPNDFRVQLKLLEHLVTYQRTAVDKSKILSIYENIQKNCTADSIRIRAKKYYICYCQMLSAVNGSDVTFEDYRKIIEELPKMSDCQEMSCFDYVVHDSGNYEKVHEAIEEGVKLTLTLLSDYSLCSSKFTRKQQIKIIEKMIDFFNFIYDDGNYGKMWTFVINCCYGILGWFCFETGNSEKALENLRKSAELAVRFDSLDRFTVLHSTLFEGRMFDKHIIGIDFSAKSWLKELLAEQYPLSDEFKSTSEFKEIIAMLE